MTDFTGFDVFSEKAAVAGEGEAVRSWEHVLSL